MGEVPGSSWASLPGGHSTAETARKPLILAQGAQGDGVGDGRLTQAGS